MKFEGLVPAAITPMTAEGGIHEEAFRKVLDFNLDAGVHGFWVAGGTGESVLLDDQENRRLAEISAEQLKDRGIVIMHVGAATTARAASLAEHAAKVGATAICCVPPFFYRRTNDEIVEHYRVIAAAADLPLFVYNLPGMTGVEITVDLMKKIQDVVPQLVGLKHSSVQFSNVHEFAQMGLQCFIGSSALMLPALSLGGVGCVDGPPLMAPELWMRIWDAHVAGDRSRAEQAQGEVREVISLAKLCGGGRYFAIMKAVLGHRIGLDCGDPRPPALGLTAAQKTEVVRVAEDLGLGPA
ncbi:MAG: dihydrodipicolinate synthase family protein [Candidatus Latescibacterota bacterium]|nr:dihydrodipicolinate synthase family protein [Candidatus Latescibacterota bacterium]